MTGSSDRFLLPFLSAESEEASERCLARLINEQAAPVIQAVIRGKLHTPGGDPPSRQEAEDLYAEAVLQLLARLRVLSASPHSQPIADFRGYVAVVAYNACHHYLRRKYPARWRLKNRLRYLLTHRRGFALWEDEGGGWLCGLDAWRGRRAEAAAGAAGLRGLAGEVGAVGVGGAGASADELADLLEAIFGRVGGPARLEELTGLVAELLGVSDRGGAAHPEELPDAEALRGDGAAADADFAVELERRSYLRRLWAEITQLPRMQRAALLLNLRDAQEGVIALLPLAGVATIRQIAEQVGLPPEEFASLWGRLPLEDRAVAELLGVTRQQVINLRKAARARLGRRMKPLGEAG